MKTNEFESAKAAQEVLESARNESAKKLQDFLSHHPRAAMNLVPDNIKQLPEYKKLRTEFQEAHDALRDFNGDFVKKFKKELLIERRAKEAVKVIFGGI